MIKVINYLSHWFPRALCFSFIEANGFPRLQFDSFLGLGSTLVSHSFELKGDDLRRFEWWIALLSLSALGENLSVKCDFLYGLWLLEMPWNKGFGGFAGLKWKFIFNHWKNFIGNLITPCECLLVASKQGNTPTMKKTNYYIKRASRLALLPRSKNVLRLMTANHIAMGNARQREIASRNAQH